MNQYRRLVALCTMFFLVCGAVGVTLAAVPIGQPSSASARRDPVTSRVSVGYDHGCAVLDDGGVECWGDNSNGELGVTPPTDSPTPVRADLPSDWYAVSVAVGEHHSCALLADGGVGCWGQDLGGQLGSGAGYQGPGPVRVQLPTHRSAVALSTGFTGTCAVLDDGTVACWGFQSFGELGQTSNGIYDTPQTVMMPAGEAAVDISVGITHTCAVLDTGAVTCWGDNTWGQFGNGTTTPSITTGSASTPVLLEAGVRALSVAASNNFTCAVSERGRVYCWGDNRDGRLGDGTTTSRATPAQISPTPARQVVEVVTGDVHACARMDDGSVSCWGENFYGQVGDGTTDRRVSPVAISFPEPVVALASGNVTTCAALADHTTTCWGRNDHGQVGDGTTSDRTSPVAPRSFDSGTRVVAVAPGGNHTCLLNSEGLVWCWGQNLYGQLGQGFTSTRELQPADPVTLPSPGRAKAITSGVDHTCALLVDGRVSCWGSNSSGQLGVGAAGNRSTPSAPINLQGSGRAKAISAGGSHTCALHTDGSIACWGYNLYGQLGDTGNTNQFATHDVVNLPGGVSAIAVTTGLDHSCALLATGAMACWGRNGDGQVGDATTNDRNSPVTVSVPPGTRAVAIDAGRFHTCALFGAGTVTCWGSNSWGQLGLDASTTPLLDSPSGTLSLPGGPPTQAIELAAGDSHSCVLLDDGTAACWGYNGDAQLGDGTTTTRHTPATVAAQPNGAHIRTLSAGYNHNVTVLEDGSLSCWGANFNGQLGTGDRTTLISPDRCGVRTLPSNLTGATTSATVGLTWTEPTSPYGPQTWDVEGSTDGTTWWSATVSVISPLGTTVSGLTNGVPYTFRVRSTTPLTSGTVQLSGFVTPLAPAPGTCEGTPDAVFPVGDGSAGNPYRVTTSAQLEAMRLPACLDRHFEQQADIAIPSGTAWDRIGTIAAPFTGAYHGGGHTISNVSMSGTVPGVGFFGSVSGATITDVHLTNVAITAPAGSPSRDGRAGTLAGNVLGSTVSGVTVSNATVSVTGQSIGGLIGRVGISSAAPTTITQSSAHASVSGNNAVGGLLGSIVSASTGHVTVSASYSAGSVTGDQDIGGLIGFVLRTSTGTVTVQDSYSAAAAEALQLVAGGLVGGVNPYSAGGITVSRSYSLGSVSAGADSGGLIGLLYPNFPSWLVVTDSFWDTATSGQATSAGGTGLSTTAMTRVQTFMDAGWSIVSGSSGGATWGQCEGSYPVLMWQFSVATPPCLVVVAPSAPWTSDLVNQPTPSPDDDDVPAVPESALPTAAQILRLPLRTLVDPSALSPGATVSFTVNGFVDGEPVTVLVASSPRLLNTVTTSPNGVMSATVTIPADLGLGVHNLAVWAPGSQRGYRQEFTVDEPDSTVDVPVEPAPSPQDSLPSTGQNPLWITLCAMVISVLGWTMIRRRRDDPAHHPGR